MRTRTLVALAALSTLLSVPALAADQSIDLSSGQASFSSIAAVLQGGDDVITFTGLAPGLYDVVFSLSAQFVGGLSGTVNATPFSVVSLGPVSLGAYTGQLNGPFSVTILGTPGSSRAVYSGEITVTAVPEASTYAMLLGGLGLLAFAQRRQRQG